jgi:hypothetical protein
MIKNQPAEKATNRQAFKFEFYHDFSLIIISQNMN